MVSLAWLFATAEQGSGSSLSHAGILSVADPVGALPTIRFSLPQAGDLQVSVWNTLGQRVSAFSASNLLAGVYAVSWDGLDLQGRSVGAGVYFIRIVANGRSYSHKTVVFRGVRGRTRISYAGATVEPPPAAVFQAPVSGLLGAYVGQSMTAEDWHALASPRTYAPAVRHRAFGRALAHLQTGSLSRLELERGTAGAVAGRSGLARRRLGLAKPVLLEQNGTLYQVHEAQYLTRFRGINLLGDGEQDGDVDSDDLFRAADALENQEPYYDLNLNGGVDLWDLFAVVDHMGLRRDGPFLLLNEAGFRLCEAGVSEGSAGDFPRIEYFNPAAPSVSAVLESLICGGSDQPLDVQRPGIEPFVVVRSALPNHMRFISPLNFWSGVSDTAGAQASTRIVQEVHREDPGGALLDGLHYVAFGYRLPQVTEDGELISQTYDYSQVLVFGWHFSLVFDGLPKLDTFPIDPNLDVGYEPTGPAAISQLTATGAAQAGRFLVRVNANRVTFGMTFFVSHTSLEVEELTAKGIPVPILAESGLGFARAYEVEIPAGEWLLYGGLLIDGGNLAGLGVSQISSTGPVVTVEEISFEDSDLEAVVRSAIAKPEGALFPADMATLNELVASGLGIEDLAGIEHLTGLQRLDLRSNKLVDLTPLGALVQLRDLYLGNNQISDFAPLTRLVQLNAVGLENNQIEEFAALVENSGLRRGDTIDLRGNPLTENAILNALCALERRRVSVLANALSCVDIENLEAAGLEKPLLFADINLELAVREAIGKRQGNLFSTDVKGLRNLNAAGRGIVDLGGIEQVTDLVAIDLRSNRIAELDPLSGIPNLTAIQLSDNEVADLSPLADMTQLQVLSLRSNRIQDVSALVSNDGLQERDVVDLCGNPLGGRSTDAQLNTLRARLVAVDTTVVFADVNLETAVRAALARPKGVLCLDDVEPLESLNLNFGEVESLEGIATLKNLAELHAVGNRISDLGPLSAGENLRALFLDRNQIAELDPLQGLPRLTRVSLDHNQINSLAPLAGSANLESLTVSNNQLTDIAPVASLTILSTFVADGNQIEDLGPLALLNTLRDLSLRDNLIIDLAPLESLTNLTALSLDQNQIRNLSHLSGLENLESLSLGNNLISDIRPLAALSNLASLSLSTNRLTNLEPLAELFGLKTLLLDANQIGDLSPLLSNQGIGLLDIVSLRENPLSDEARSDQIPTLKNRGVEVVL